MYFSTHLCFELYPINEHKSTKRNFPQLRLFYLYGLKLLGPEIKHLPTTHPETKIYSLSVSNKLVVRPDFTGLALHHHIQGPIQGIIRRILTRFLLLKLL